MTQALLLPRGVPLEVDVGTGRNWLQAHYGPHVSIFHRPLDGFLSH